jgi:predicted component of type VI protein secretion system
MKAELVPDNGDPPIPITKDVTIVGRRDYCDIQIDHPSLSKRHCVLVKTDGLLVIRDLATTNGTKVKGQKVRWAALLPDDLLTLGNYKMRVYLGPDDAPGPSELSRWGAAARRGAAAAPQAQAPAPRAAGIAVPLRAAEPASVRDAPPVVPFRLDDEDGSNSDDSGWQRLLIAGGVENDPIVELE